MAGLIEERARVAAEPVSAELIGDRVHVPADGMRGAVLGRVRGGRPDRRGDDQRTQHPGSRRVVGRLLGTVPQRVPDTPELPRRSVGARAGRRRELPLHRRIEPHVQLHAARGDVLLGRARAGRRRRETLHRPHPEDRRGRRPRWSARQPGAGRDQRGARGPLPSRQAGRHLPVRAGHPRHVDRRPRGVPGRRPARGRRDHRVGTVRTGLPRRGAGSPAGPPTTTTRATPTARTAP